MGNGNYRTWEPLTAPVLELGEVLGLGHMGLEMLAIWSSSDQCICTLACRDKMAHL